MTPPATPADPNAPILVWGVPLVPWTMARTVARIDELCRGTAAEFFITANLNYAMICDGSDELARLNDAADFIVADGMPLVWASRFRRRRLPERVAGSDLIFEMAGLAADRGYRIYFLGGVEGTGQAAADVLVARYPGVQVVGIECPPFRAPTAEEQTAQHERIRAAAPHMLFVAFGQPKGEYWIRDHQAAVGVPLAVQVGGTFELVSGKLKRAPGWMRKTGAEWFFRMIQEPRRLGGRYARNALFILKMLTVGPKRRR